MARIARRGAEHVLTIGIEMLSGRYHATPWGRRMYERGRSRMAAAPFSACAYSLRCVEAKATPLGNPSEWSQILHVRSRSRGSALRVTGGSAIARPCVLSAGWGVRGREEARLRSVRRGRSLGACWSGWAGRRFPLSAEVGADLGRELLGVVSYLGRAESLASLARLSPHDEVDWNCRPLATTRSTPGEEVVRVAGLAAPEQHRLPSWRWIRRAARSAGRAKCPASPGSMR